MTVPEYLHALGEASGHGWGFLTAYGLTWLVCALAWRRWSSRIAAYATLFQGMVALPLALALTALGPGPDRPTMAGMDSLTILLASGQLLGLPIIIYLVAAGRFTLVPLSMVLLLVVHFAPYSWLYATPLYVVMGGILAIAAVIATASAQQARTTAAEAGATGAVRLCLATGLVMLVCAAVAWSL
jgi:hypothetical protein